MKISACLIVKNEELHIEECLKSLKFADEIIVIERILNIFTIYYK